MSTILIDRRTAALLGELAAQPADAPAAVTAHAVGRRPSGSVARIEVRGARSESQGSASTRPSDPLRKSASREAAAVTVRRPAAGGASVRRTVRCRPAAEGAGVSVEATARRRQARTATAAKPTLHLTRRGRVVALLLLLVLVTLAFSVGRVTSTALGAGAGAPEHVVVQQGDTLWSIAERISPDSDPRAVTGELMAVNGLASPSLEVGQQLRLP